MQILLPRFKSQQFFLCKICGEIFHPNLQRLTSNKGLLNEYHVCISMGKVQNMGPLVHEPPLWIGSMDRLSWIGSMDCLSWTGSMDPLTFTRSMDPLFLLALKLIVIKDYECLCYNLNSCLLLKSFSLRTAENLQIKSFPPSETWTLVSGSTRLLPRGSTPTLYFDNVMMKFMINYRTDT